MTVWVDLFRGALLLTCVVLSGCLPPTHSASDEEKEPHFLAGKSRVSSMDFTGAIECFEKALELNPQSAAAHFELGWLFDQKEADPAAAIYHYERYLKLRPNAENAEMVKTRILAGKQELARTVSLGPVTQTMQREFEQLAEENKRLREESEKWRAYVSRLQGQTNPPGPAAPVARAAQPVPAGQQPPTQVVSSSSPGGAPQTAPTTVATRRHTVKAGETPTTIARQYGVKVDALLAANPRLEPRRMQIGQAVSIP